MVKKPKKSVSSSPPNVRVQILAVAREEFVTRGYSGARMQSIAKKAGVHHALLHYYFGSKDKLYEAALRETVATIWEGIRRELRALPPDCGFETLLKTLLRTHARILSQHMDFPAFLLRNLLDLDRALPKAIGEVVKSDILGRINQSLAKEIKAGRMIPILPLHFWLNLIGMTVAGFIAPQILGRMGTSNLPPETFSEKFYLDRAEMIASLLIEGLRPGKHHP